MEIEQARTNWEDWKGYLGHMVEFAEELGMSQDRIKNMAAQAGDMLARHVPPANPEQRVLKELWEAADEQEQQMLAGLMTKLAKRS
ncbi:MAG: DUF3243 domain-containing protein [Peptococcaceae bacterium]|jgi:hypothetical protein|nr:DUF3243 domain-containing protein [Peptococcaceae bacterium]